MAGRVWGGNGNGGSSVAPLSVDVVDPDGVATELIPVVEADEWLDQTRELPKVPGGTLADEIFDESKKEVGSRSWQGGRSSANPDDGLAVAMSVVAGSAAAESGAKRWQGKLDEHITAAEFNRRRRRRTVGNVLIGLVVLVLVAGGGFAVWSGMQLRSIDAPLPPSAMSTGDGKTQVGDDGHKPVEVLLDDGSTGDGWSDGSDGAGGSGTDKGSKKGTMSLAKMDNSSVFVPAIGAYAPVLGTNQTKESRHAGWQTLMIPTNPRKVSWYSAGADLAGGTEGTTLLAGHIAYNGVNGSFRWLANVKVGNVAYTKNANGATQKWIADKVFYREQTDFPQSYWSAEGPRQLILVTCGGSFANGHYSKNVFVSFVPAPPEEPSTKASTGQPAKMR